MYCQEGYQYNNGKCTIIPISDTGGFGIFLLIMLYIILSIANLPGIVSGCSQISIFVLGFKYKVKQSNNPVQISMLGQVLSLACFIMPWKHPTQDRLMIDYDLALFLTPPLLIGNTIGMIANQSAPELFISIQLLLFFSMAFLLALNQLIYFYRMRKNEEKLKIQKQKEKVYKEERQEEEAQKMAPVITPEIKQNDGLVAQQSAIPLARIVQITLIFIFYYGLQVILGNKNLKSYANIELCSDVYWVIFFLRIIVCFVIFFLIRKMLLQQIALVNNNGTQIEIATISRVDYKDFQEFLRLATLSIIVGFFVGSIGTGGGSIFIPYLIGQNYIPLQASFTVSFFNILLGISGAIQVILQGVMTTDDILILIFGTFVGCLFFTSILMKIYHYYKFITLPLICAETIAFMEIITLVTQFALDWPSRSMAELTQSIQYC